MLIMFLLGRNYGEQKVLEALRKNKFKVEPKPDSERVWPEC